MVETFKVAQLDHVHVYVSDQQEAAQWYQRVLGLEVVDPPDNDLTKGGPLTISSDGGNTSLALFRGELADRRNTIAFRVDGKNFLSFIKRLETLELNGREGAVVTAQQVVDHQSSYSIYFYDPYGNPYELTSYDYQLVKESLSMVS